MRSHGQLDWKIARTLFILAFFAYASFLQDPRNPNSSSRLFLVYAMVTNGSLSIDEFAHKTIDRAEFRGHFYSDKAPGQAFLALPAVAAFQKPAERWEESRSPVAGWEDVREWPPGYRLSSYAATLLTSGLLTALSVASLFLVAQSIFGSPGTATLVAITYGFGTPAFGWATAFFGHAPAMALSVIGMSLLHFAALAASADRRVYALVIAGAASLTAAVITEFTAAPAALLIALVTASRSRMAASDLVRLALVGLVSAIAISMPLLLYNQLAFGSPLHLGYSSVQDFPGMKEGFFGLRTPSLQVLGGILIGPQRGILWICPVLVIVPFGLWRMAKDPLLRRYGALALLVIAYYLLLNSSYYYWNGGWSTGPRHITAMLPFACLAIGAFWQQSGTATRGVVMLLIVASLGLALLCTLVGMYAPENEPQLLRGYLIPSLLGGANTATPVWLFALMRSRQFIALWVLASAAASALLIKELRRVPVEAA